MQMDSQMQRRTRRRGTAAAVAVVVGLLALLLLALPPLLPVNAADPATSSDASSATADITTEGTADDAAATSAAAAVSTGGDGPSSSSPSASLSLSGESAEVSARRAREEAARDAKYVVGLLSSLPRLPGQTGTAPGSRVVTMTAQSGRRFRCLLPDPAAKASNLLGPDAYENEVQGHAMEPLPGKLDVQAATQQQEQHATEQPDAEASASSSSASTPDSAAPSSSPTAAASGAAGTPPTGALGGAGSVASASKSSKPTLSDAVLAPRLVRKHLSAGCFTQHVDYWSYEVCPFRSARQYHRDGASQAVSMEFSLGHWVGPGDSVAPLPGGVIPPVQLPTTPATGSAASAALSGKPGPNNAYSIANPVVYTQLFEGGSNNREALVRFLCNPDPSPAANTRHLLLSVREPRVGHYEFDVRTTLMCRDARGQLGGDSEKSAAGKHDADASSSSSTAAKLQSAELTRAAQEAAATKLATAASAGKEDIETGRLGTGTRRRAAGGAQPKRAAASSPSSGKGSPSAAAVAPHVMDLLEPLGSECLYLNTGWWTYKFCYLKEISQFHREAVAVPASPAAAAQAQARAAATAKVPPPKTGARSAAEAAANIAEHKAAVDAAMAAAGGGTAATAASAATPAPPMSARMQITAEFLLGRLPLDAPAESLEQLARTRVVQGASWEDSYVSQHYEDGTLCDLSGRPRQAETRLYCSPEGDGETGTNSLGAIRAVTESSTCQYIVTIATPLLCAHPLFRPRVPSLLEIACTPIDDDEGAAALTAAISSSSSSSSSRTPSTGTLKHQRVSSGDTKMLLINAHGDARAVP